MKRLLSKKATRKNFITYAFVIVAFIIFQILNTTGGLSSTMSGQLVPICVYIILALSLNLTVGVLGELSLGHAGFMSIGAFAGAITASIIQFQFGASTNSVVCLIVSILVGAIFAAIAGVLIGIPVLRLNGDYLAIVTLAFGEIIRALINVFYVGIDKDGLHFSFLNTDNLTLDAGGKLILNGASGISGITKISSFFAGFVLIMICLIIIFNFVNSRSGRAVMAIRDNRIAVDSIGIPAARYKLLAFVISAALAGMGGALFALGQNSIVASKFDFNTSILILVFVVLGGLGNMLGSIIAATVLTVLPEALRGFSEYRMLLYAIVLILVMIFTNNPILKGLVSKIIPIDKLKKKFSKKEANGGVKDV